MAGAALRRWRKRLAWAVVAVLLLPPAWLLVHRVVPVQMTPLMVLRAVEGADWRQDWVPLSAMAPALGRSVIAAEDNLFCRHAGFDWRSLGQAAEEYIEGDRVRGASTLTMQTAKNVLLWPGRSFLRKGLEAYVTVWMEALWPKTRILEVYLNVAEWGPGIYGAEAAARHHFGRPAARLSADQAARLAAVLPNPLRLSAGQPSAHVRQRAGVVRTRIRQLGPLLDCLPR